MAMRCLRYLHEHCCHIVSNPQMFSECLVKAVTIPLTNYLLAVLLSRHTTDETLFSINPRILKRISNRTFLNSPTISLWHRNCRGRPSEVDQTVGDCACKLVSVMFDPQIFFSHRANTRSGD